MFLGFTDSGLLQQIQQCWEMHWATSNTKSNTKSFSLAADRVPLLCVILSVFFSTSFNQPIYLSLFLLSLLFSLSPFPPVLSSVSICSCCPPHLPPPTLLSCPVTAVCCHYSAALTTLQLLPAVSRYWPWSSDEHSWPRLSSSGFTLCDVIWDTVLRSKLSRS